MKYINGFLALSFLLMGFASAEFVVDTSGFTVVPFDEYYILPFNFALGGGLSLANTENKTSCPVDVIKEISEVENGMPLKIIPVPKIGFVPTSTNLRIVFANAPECAQSSEWILVKDDDEKWFVGIGGPEDHPGRETVAGWFVIEKYEEGYKLMFCPQSTVDVCGNVGIVVDENHNRRLSLVDEGAYVVVFRKASSGNSDII